MASWLAVRHGDAGVRRPHGPATSENRCPALMVRSSLSRPVVPGIAGSSVDRPQRVHERHRPEETLLYKLVAEHLETFLAESREKHDRPLPKYVERELRAYLRCGISAHGFGRAECRWCHRQIVVAFSCKMRGLCPSCNARRMCNSAAHLTDRVLPDVPIRQWVLSVPFELRFLLASNAQAFTALTRIFMEETLAWYRRRAVEVGISGGQGGAVSVQHRFGGALNLNCHVHAAVIDGVFTRATTRTSVRRSTPSQRPTRSRSGT